MFDGSFAGDAFAIEQFRELLPDRVLAAVYNARRNWGGPPDEMARVRYLAGVTDEHGAPQAGYVLNANGCINDSGTH